MYVLHRTLYTRMLTPFLTARSWALFFAFATLIVFLAVLCQLYGVPDQLKAAISWYPSVST